jgi:ubiquinone/menaquinone biosynthesis C-methylase UbiE
VLGDGDGRFLARLVREGEASADYVDLSAGMLALARSRAGSERVTYHHADARVLPLLPGEYDLIASHFFFDCFEARDARLLIERVTQAAQPRAQWLVSEFRQPPWARLFLRGLYLFFRVTTGLKTRRLTDHRPLLAEKGFRLVREETSRFGLLASELWIRAASA